MDLTLDDADKLRPGDLLFKYRSGRCEGAPLQSYLVLSIEHVPTVGHHVYVYHPATQKVSRLIVNWLTHCGHIRVVGRMDA